MLILFDIDGTLLLSRGAGVKAFLESCRELLGLEMKDERRRFSGGLDPLIFRDLCQAQGVHDWERHHDAFRTRYGEAIRRHLAPEGVVERLAGSLELVREVDAHPAATLGLLTGNYPETGRFKIERAGFDPDRFEIAAWGIDGGSRRDLPKVAMTRFHDRRGHPVAPSDVVIIGDTPNDVDCAKANGCRVLAVATGMYSTEELAECGADLVVADLSATTRLKSWLFGAG
jgi:phosphoglycolate phosphatase